MVDAPIYSSDDEEGLSLVLDRAQSKVKTTRFIYVITFVTAISGFLFGYDTGIVSGAMVFIKDEFALNNIWQEMVVSVTILGAWIFSAVGGYTTEAWGRKPVLIVSGAVFTVGAALMGAAWCKEILLLGRLIVGAALGFASMTVPIYIAEIAPASIRGILIVVNTAFVTGGQFIAAIIAGGLSGDKQNGWRFMLSIAGIPSLIQFVLFFFLPETPRWLVRRGKYEDSLKVLRKIRGQNANIEEEFESIKDACVEQEREIAEKGGTSVIEQILHSSSLRKALFVGCSLQIIQQLAAINSVMYYSATIIQMSGVYSKTKAVWLASATAAMNFGCTFIGMFLVEKVGRRTLTLSSLAGVILSLCVLGVGFQVAAYNSPPVTYKDNSTTLSICHSFDNCQSCSRHSSCGYCYTDATPINATCLNVAEDHRFSVGGVCKSGTIEAKHLIWAYEWCPTNHAWITFVGLLVYLFFFAFGTHPLCVCISLIFLFTPGMGPMPWTINSEIYPQWARSVCQSTATSMNWFFNFLVSLTFLTLSQAITKYGAFYLYAGFSTLGWILFYFALPETKGKSLEEVETLFSPTPPATDNTWATLMGSQSVKKNVKYVHIKGVNRSTSELERVEER